MSGKRSESAANDKRSKSKGDAKKSGKVGLQSLRESRIVKKLQSAIFVELPAFERHRQEYLEDAAFLEFQNGLLDNPEAGEVIQNTGGLRKIRVADEGRGKGKRSGIRVIYFWCEELIQFWLFTLYDKDESDDLTADQKKMLKQRLKDELKSRVTPASTPKQKGKS